MCNGHIVVAWTDVPGSERVMSRTSHESRDRTDHVLCKRIYYPRAKEKEENEGRTYSSQCLALYTGNSTAVYLRDLLANRGRGGDGISKSGRYAGRRPSPLHYTHTALNEHHQLPLGG